MSGGVLEEKADMEEDAYWILGLGGIGIAVGLFVCRTLFAFV